MAYLCVMFLGLTVVSYFSLDSKVFQVFSNSLAIIFSLIIFWRRRSRLVDPLVFLTASFLLGFFINYFLTISYFEKFYENSIISLANLYIECYFYLFYLFAEAGTRGASFPRLIYFKGMFGELNPVGIRFVAVICTVLTLWLNVLSYKTTHTFVAVEGNIVLDLVLMINKQLVFLISTYTFYLISIERFKISRDLVVLLPVVLSIGAALISGSRGAAFFYALDFVIVYYCVRQNLPWRIIVLAMLFLILIIPISLVVRGSDEFESSGNVSLNDKIALYSESASHLNLDSDTLGISLGFAFGRFGMLQSAYRIVAYVPGTVDFRYGETTLPLLIKSLIPQSLIAREQTNIGKWFGYNFSFTESEDREFISAGIANEFYINFGIFALAIVPFFAFFLGRCYSILVTGKGTVIGYFLVHTLLIGMFLFHHESYFADFFSNVIKNGLLLIVVCEVVRTRSSTSQRHIEISK